MIVTFISQCEKKAIPRTRRVLDAFANRIGNNTWQTVITEDGLAAVKNLLRKTASKNTAVSCHRIATRRQTELVWIVGNRGKFNSEGIVPVNRTQKSLSQNKWENDWHYLPLIKALVAVSALLHDWGKASVLFQQKLTQNTKKGDPLRHEWISCLLFNALVQHSGDNLNDDAWLNLFIQQNWQEQDLKDILVGNIQQAHKFKALDKLPPIAQMVAWLIVSHHRLPNILNKDKIQDYTDIKKSDLSSLLKSIQAEWGYLNPSDEADYQTRLKQCFEFQQGLLSQSKNWTQQIKKWSNRLLQEIPNVRQTIDDGSWRVVLHHARLCLMLGDHYYSSLPADDKWKTNLSLIANTDPKTKRAKQFLDEHLCHVSQNGLKVSQSLSRLAEEMESAYDIHKLKQKSPQGFEWQDNAVRTIRQFIQKNPDELKQGWFVVNMASTGKGKTIANAKIMQALSIEKDALRYILALGLRTLTLQTGDSYRHDIGLNSSELAVLIGSKAVQELHENQNKKAKDEEKIEDFGSESLEDLLDNELDNEDIPQAEFMQVLFPPNKAQKNQAFLYKPVLVCTIDHIMAATETKRGGKYILPCLRLLSSDLVIDEVDDFNGQDLVAIARLIHLAGMLGRKVMISSATIPPALAEGFFHAYQHGWQLYCAFKRLKNTNVTGMWVDEFKSQIKIISLNEPQKTIEDYRSYHQKFVGYRIQALEKQIIKHKLYIVDCEDLISEKETNRLDESLQTQYFERMKQQAELLHQQHHSIDPVTGKKVSFGVIRVANIPPCVALTQYLLHANWKENISPRVMAYHSRQVLLLRHEQETNLDSVLKRKEKTGEMPKALNHPIIRQHLDSIDDENVIFILVATPVEEVGRDHDFDWAIIEPSSYRSIIQLAGRVLRHRKLEQNIESPNIALMQYNLRALRKAKVAFEKPGFEMNNKLFRLDNKDLKQLLDDSQLASGCVNAIPRIEEHQPLQAKQKLADLEHAVMAHHLTNYQKNGAKQLNGWLNETWYLTALPQQLNPFRASSPNIQLFLICKKYKLTVCEKDDFGQYIERNLWYDITHIELNDLEKQRLWLNRNYSDILRRIALDQSDVNDDIDDRIEKLSQRYGELMLPEYDSNKKLKYSDQFGLVVLD